MVQSIIARAHQHYDEAPPQPPEAAQTPVPYDALAAAEPASSSDYEPAQEAETDAGAAAWQPPPDLSAWTLPRPGSEALSAGAAGCWKVAASLGVLATVVAPAVYVGGRLVAHAVAARGSEAAGDDAVLGSLLLLWGGLGGTMVAALVAPAAGVAAGTQLHRAWRGLRGSHDADAAA